MEAILTPEVSASSRLQLQILAALAHGMAEAEQRDHLLRAEGLEEVWDALGEVLRGQDLARVRT